MRKKQLRGEKRFPSLLHISSALFNKFCVSQWRKQPRTAMGAREQGLKSQETLLKQIRCLIFSKAELSKWPERKTTPPGISNILFRQTSSSVLPRKCHMLAFAPQLAPFSSSVFSPLRRQLGPLDSAGDSVLTFIFFGHVHFHSFSALWPPSLSS